MKTLNPAVARVLKRLHYPLDIMLTCVRWYVAYPLSLRHLEGLCHVDWAMTQTDGGCVFAQTVDGFWVSSVKRCHESKR